MSGTGLARICVCLAAGGVLVGAAGATPPEPDFTTAQLVATVQTAPANLQEIGTADLNGDGNADVLVTRIDFEAPQPEPVTVLAGDGKGHFADVTTSVFDGPVAKPVYPRRIVFADFNGDGRPDVFIADTGPDGLPFPGYPNTLILSAPNGKLVDASANLPRTPDFTHSAAAADVDGNGTIDLYAGNLSSGCDGCATTPPEILLNNGTGHFRISDGALPREVASVGAPHYDGAGFADVNGDGKPDLVLAGSPGNPNRLLLNDGTGHFHDAPNALPDKPWTGVDSEGLAVTPLDVNGDGHVDLLIAYTKNHPFYAGHWIQVLINNGDGTAFRDETATRMPQDDNNGSWPYAIQVADMNGDGKPDLGLSLWWGSGVKPLFWINQGDGTFRPFSSLVTLAMYPSFVFLDANRDGRIDLFSTKGSFSEEHYLSLQRGPVVTPKPKPKPKPKCKPKPPHKRCK